MIPALPFYVRATFTTGRRPDGDGWNVVESPVEHFGLEGDARARVAELRDAGFTVVLGAVLDVPGLGFANWGVEDAHGVRLPRVPENWRDLVAR